MSGASSSRPIDNRVLLRDATTGFPDTPDPLAFVLMMGEISIRKLSILRLPKRSGFLLKFPARDFYFLPNSSIPTRTTLGRVRHTPGSGGVNTVKGKKPLFFRIGHSGPGPHVTCTPLNSILRRRPSLSEGVKASIPAQIHPIPAHVF